MAKIKTDRFKLAEMRIRHGYSCTGLAKELGVSKQAISLIETGRTNPTPALAKKIVEFLNVPYDCIFSIVEGE